ncbi:succinate dehydrogenase flavoprotein subunit [Pantoea sp. JGM49]|uniref:succinate dehydrogenase flavoprotein subunit n=1 Tax=Pantoea sp. JGM49 TaxID=2799791 RepID=UPI001BA7F3C8|nr:succinate dehydrogenase flavoprotein subunit [Pantoea sp. JGM49]MBS0883471.1 succinate dehydrogenase flavoprotein subunit [Pantoea sp. JGM49]
MISDSDILAQARAFVYGLKGGQGVHVPAMTFRQWPRFMRLVHQLQAVTPE